MHFNFASFQDDSPSQKQPQVFDINFKKIYIQVSYNLFYICELWNRKQKCAIL